MDLMSSCAGGDHAWQWLGIVPSSTALTQHLIRDMKTALPGHPSLQGLTNMQGKGTALKGLIFCAVQTFGLEIITNGNGTIVSQALNYWQTLSSNGGGVAVGAIVEVGLGVKIMT